MTSGQNIVIFSPQRWNHLYISKHHYALELARNNKVWFISAPDEKMGSGYIVDRSEEVPGLMLVHYKILQPEIFKFKLPGLYKKATEKKLSHLVQKLVGKVDWCIDFGCYQFLNNLDFVKADKKIFFPVDDFGDLKLTHRGANKIFSVSTSIVGKFKQAGLDCAFINHGLSNVFAEKARLKLQESSFSQSRNGKLRIGYSGNLFIRFLDIPPIRRIIEENPNISFHFFGNTSFDSNNKEHANWCAFLKSAQNVHLYGFLKPEALASAYEEMDGFLLSYKPDYKDYHGENSHKVFEYLSTGKVLVSTHLSLYDGNELMRMTPRDKNEFLPAIFKEVITNVDQYNSEEMQRSRISFALENTYEKQIERIEKLCVPSEVLSTFSNAKIS